MSDVPGREPVEEEFDPAEIVDETESEPDEPELDEDEGEELEPEEGAPPEPVAATPKQGRKGQAERWRERAERLERDIAELKTQRQQPAAPVIDPAAQARAEAEKWERRAMMSPVELAQDIQREERAAFTQALLAVRNESQDLIDKQAYELAARTDPRYTKHRQVVEARLAQERAVGNYRATRKDILAYQIGLDALDRPAPARQQRAASARVASQTTRPVGARGDVARGGRRPAAGSLEEIESNLFGALDRGESIF